MAEENLRSTTNLHPLFVFGVVIPPLLVFFAFAVLSSLIWLRLVLWVAGGSIYPEFTPEVLRGVLDTLIPAIPSLALVCFGVVSACGVGGLLVKWYEKLV